MHIMILQSKIFDNQLFIFETGSNFYKQLPVFWLLCNVIICQIDFHCPCYVIDVYQL